MMPQRISGWRHIGRIELKGFCARNEGVSWRERNLRCRSAGGERQDKTNKKKCFHGDPPNKFSVFSSLYFGSGMSDYLIERRNVVRNFSPQTPLKSPPLRRPAQPRVRPPSPRRDARASARSCASP